MTKLPPAAHNVIRQRGSPTEATLASGHTVEKQEYVYFLLPKEDKRKPDEWRMVRCADYHGEHFVYLDPLYLLPATPVDPNKSQTGRGHFFALCSCGSPAVIVGPSDAAMEDSDCPEQLLVCFYYHSTLVNNGWGRHADQEGMRRWT